MKPSRTRRIILAAENKVAGILDLIPDGRKKRNAEAVNAVCTALVKRRTPIKPTALAVTEEGRNLNPHFPAYQTIYNTYSNILDAWREAYYDVVNIDADPPLSSEGVDEIDTSIMEVGTANIVDRLKVIIFELTQRNNVLKQIIGHMTPAEASGDSLASEHEEVVLLLGKWIRRLADSPAFQLDEFALKVSRKTPPGTRIIDVELLDKLLAFTEEFEAACRARRSIS
ncbi:hypothetical protein CFBP4996_17790 [Agrobacterium leguminum]|uniref:Uncharacterized protein n=1 Tax=Agrobacterium deltaense NCPPB 1641 TaxID=1183425 RepID=A0A1S7TYK9_9HYPH|nr:MULTISPECIES: hypothetical protein [Agrobacterium]WFS67878.1 hypothetical protein CFBP4996_17790 [Agrobacterium leguminum]CVI59698.1 conserved hypothetical protein [Agrobacterium deltaense NCPPB 1641]